MSRQARRRRSIALLQLVQNRFQRLAGLGVRGFAIGLLQPLAHGRLLGLGQVGHDILALVPLAALHQRSVGEHLLHRRAQPLAAVDHHQQTRVAPQAALLQLPHKRAQHALVLRARLHEAQRHFATLQR